MTMSPFERWAVWTTTAGTLVTGLVYWWLKDFMAAPEPWAVINHPLQPWVLKAHILVAPLLIFAVGLITMRHIWQHIRLGVRRGRRTGCIAALTLFPMILTGYALQILTAETLLRLVGWTHLGLGIVYSVGVAAHWPAIRARNPVPTRRAEASEDAERGFSQARVDTVGRSGLASAAHGVRIPAAEARPSP